MSSKINLYIFDKFYNKINYLLFISNLKILLSFFHLDPLYKNFRTGLQSNRGLLQIVEK